MSGNGKPPQETRIDTPLVRALLAEQHPDLAAAPLTPLAEGWDNVLYRLGDTLTVRLPRRQASAQLIEHEQRWLPELAAWLPLPVPAPIRSGRPSSSLGYPWSWSVGPWLPGAAWEHTPPADMLDAASALGRFLAALHRPAPQSAPRNPFRGIPLSQRGELLQRSLASLGAAVERGAIEQRWRQLVTTPAWAGPPLWLHGDLHPLNLLVDAGQLSAVIDFGDVCAGDPAGDLSVAWMLFPPHARERLRATLAVDDNTWRRAQGWALALGAAFAAGDERIAGIGQRALAAVLSDAAETARSTTSSQR